MSESIVYTPVRKQEPERPVTWMSPRRLLILQFLSFGAFSIIWFYRQWKLFSKLWPKPVHPLLRSFLIIVPIVDIILIQELIQKLQTEMKAKGVKDTGPPGILLGLTFFVGWVFDLPIPGLSSTLQLLAILLLTGIQVAFQVRYQISLNAYWSIDNPEVSQIPPIWTTGERIVVCIGFLLWIGSLLLLAESFFTSAPPAI